MKDQLPDEEHKHSLFLTGISPDGKYYLTACACGFTGKTERPDEDRIPLIGKSPNSITVWDESLPTSIVVKARFRTIYILRGQCDRHELDKMHVFYLMDLMKLDKTFHQLRRQFRKTFKNKHKCRDRIKFTTETEQDYRWDTKLNKAVEIKT